jgi:CDGSH-type Zn-finger protein
VVARVVMRCPTGALHYERSDEGEPEPVPAANTVLISRDGPLHLRGDIEVLDDSGAPRLRDTRVALCRCGFSKNKPLCDNAHRAGGFHDAGAIHDQDLVQDPGAAGGVLRIVPHANASLELAGPFALGSDDGETLLAGTRARLCRCGQSSTKPFCDGSHERVGFKSG